MNAHVISLVGCVALAGGLWAQPGYNLYLQPGPVTAPAPWQAMVNTQAAKRSFLGIGVAEIDASRAKDLKLKEVRGVEVTRVEEDSPAEKAGLKAGDVVLAYNGQQVIGTEQFVRLVRETPVGRTVEINVSRDGAPLTLTATIGSRDERGFHAVPKVDWNRLGREMEELREFKMPDIPRAYMSWRTSTLGVEAESLDGQLADYFGVKEGVLVRSVMKDSPAEKAGLKAGDVIVKVGEEKIKTPREVSSAIRSLRSKRTFPVTVIRNRKETTLSVTLPEDRSGSRHRMPARTVRDTGTPL